MRRKLILLAAALFLIFITWLDRSVLATGHDDLRQYEGKTFRVAYVLDGDTLDIIAPDPPRATTRIRLWGIDSPEIAHPQHNDKPAEPFGPEAALFTHQLCNGKDVTLHLQPHRLRDRSDERVLAYVTLPDGSSLNERLLAAGFARADDRWAHERLDRYAQLNRQAQHDQIGLWTPETPKKISPSKR